MSEFPRFEFQKSLTHESIRQRVSIGIAGATMRTVHTDQAQHAAIRFAQKQNPASEPSANIDRNLSVRRGIDFETPGQYCVHGVQKTSRISYGYVGRNRKFFFACFVPRVFQITQSIV